MVNTLLDIDTTSGHYFEAIRIMQFTGESIIFMTKTQEVIELWEEGIEKMGIHEEEN